MNVIIPIIIMAIVIFSIAGINSIISNQQELADVNEKTIEKQLNKIQETISISGVMTDDDTAIITNDGTQDITIIQYRVYNDNGTLLGTYSVNSTVSSNSNSELTLPTELVELLEWFLDILY